MPDMSKLLRYYTGNPEQLPESTPGSPFDGSQGTLWDRSAHPWPWFLNPDDRIEFSYTVTLTEGAGLVLDVYGDREEE